MLAIGISHHDFGRVEAMGDHRLYSTEVEGCFG
jgi:hypothetical protein